MSTRDDDDSENERTQALLLAAGALQDAPPVDVARDAITLLRGRRRGVMNVNELFRIVHHLFHGLSTIFGSRASDDGGSEGRRG